MARFYIGYKYTTEGDITMLEPLMYISVISLMYVFYKVCNNEL